MQRFTFRKENWARLFFALWSGQALSLLGSQLVQFALIWWLTKTTGSATVLAMASLVGLLPQVILGPVTGALVDRWNRRWVMILADGLIAAATALLVVLFATERVVIWHIYALMLVRSAAGGFHWSAMQASTSLMVPEEHLARVQGLNQSLNGGLNILSAPLGALLLELFNVQGILMVDILTAGVAILPLLFILIPQPAVKNVSDARGVAAVWQDIKDGGRYVLGWPGLLWLGVLAMLVNLLLTPAFSLVPILVTRHFQGGAFELAWMDSLAGVGVILGGVLLGAWGGFKRRIFTALLGLIGVGLGSLLVGLTPAAAYPMALGAILVIGLSLPITNGPIFAIIQSVVVPEMQGRTFALLGSASAAISPLGLIVAGPVADAVGVQAWFVAAGVATIFIGGVALFIPALIDIERGRRVEAADLQVAEPVIQPAEPEGHASRSM